MNGRCDNDPLDPAYDVCDLCGGEFCESCLVEPTKRTRQTVCMECSLIQARVRTGKITRVRSRREAKKRRAELQAERSTIQDEGRFVFFDGDDPEPAEEVETPEPRKKKIKGRSRKEKDPILEPPAYAADGSDSDPDEDWLSQLDRLEAPSAVEPDEEFVVPEAPAVEELHKLRARRESDAPPAALLPTAPEPEPEPIEAAPSISEITPDSASFDETDPFADDSDTPAPPQPAAVTPESIAPEPTTIALEPEPAASVAPEPEPPTPVPPAPEPAASVAPELEPVVPQPEAVISESLSEAVPEVPAALAGSGPSLLDPAEELAKDPDEEAIKFNDQGHWIPPALRG